MRVYFAGRECFFRWASKCVHFAPPPVRLSLGECFSRVFVSLREYLSFASRVIISLRECLCHSASFFFYLFCSGKCVICSSGVYFASRVFKSLGSSV